MTADTPLAPKLRFPEFRDGPTWLAPQLDDLYDFRRTNTLSRDKLNYETGTIRNIHYGDIHTKFKPLFRVGNEHVPYINPDASANGFDDDAFCEEGDIALADASEDLDDVGKAIEIVSLDGERVVAGTHTILATRRGSVPIIGFGGQLFQSAVVRAGIKKEAQGAKVYGISANRISAVPVPVPPTEAEQQKVADCLGSLDGLIAAQGRTLEALRQHKQGLMQQLFPQPGVTVPRLRFPEFGDSEGWEVRTLRSVCELYQPETLAASELKQDGPYLVYGANGVIGKHDRYNHEDSEVVVTCRGATCGEVNRTQPKSWITGNAMVVRPKDDRISQDFVFYSLKSDGLKSVVSGSAQPQITRAGFSPFLFVFPERKKEQQKIADCLGSLDGLIAAQGRKIETLRQHKQGLMQQLFPSPERITS